MKGIRFARVFSISAVLLTPAIGFRPHNVLADSVPETVVRESQTVKDFFLRLYANKKAAIERKFKATYQGLVRQGLEDTEENKQRTMIALFFHDLTKSDGVFGNVYSFDAYQGITPQTMLDAIFSSPPTRVYARCDRLEMLFAGILKDVFGISARVVLIFSNHTSTEVPLSNGYLILDNSFDVVEFSRTRAKDKPPADGKYSIRRANRLATLDLSVVLDPQGVERVERAVQRYLAN